MTRPPRSAAFTLIEMITVIAIIAILAGLVLATNGLAQKNAAKARADAEIKTLSGALESYKTDNGGYPQDSITDTLDPRNTGSATDTSKGGNVAKSTLFLYKELSGDADANGIIDATETARNYAPGFFQPSRLGGTKDANTGKIAGGVFYIMDPFGNPYGYSTAGLAAEQAFRTALSTDPNASRGAQKGYNPSFDLWSSGGDTSGNSAKWVKNW